jgi:MoxR-like ATPase
MVGPTGCGKSSLAINVLARLKRKAEIFSCHGETSSEGLIGKPWVVVDPTTNEGITKVSYGAALRAYNFGKILLLEEVDMAMAGILASIQRIMEVQSDFYICDIGEQEIIPRHKLFSVIATANTIGTGEDDFMYADTKALNLSFVNRFSVRYVMGYLPKTKEIKVLINKTGIDKNIAEKMVMVANDVRDAGDPKRIAAGTVPGGTPLVSVISTRDLIEWANMIITLSLDIKEAASYAFLNCMPESDQESVQKFLENRIV